MAQADQTVQNNTFPTVRADINNNLAALFSKNSGATAPSTTVAYMDWIDTSGANPVWKKRNAANNAWITLGTIVSNTITFEGTLPSQSGQSGKYLTTDGTNASWGAISVGIDVQDFTANGTWTKPSSGTVALIRCWGGGGSGGRGSTSSGGGGGACVERWIKLSDLGATESVTIGAGGASRSTNGVGTVGGTTTFGSHVSAYGGGPGDNAGPGGGGGGSLAAGGAGTAGDGHSAITTGGTGASTGPAGKGDWGGGGGGGPNGIVGGSATWGGGGGGGRNSATVRAGGVSLNGGAGSDSNTNAAGGFPGGGSGAVATGSTGVGGAGYCIVVVY